MSDLELELLDIWANLESIARMVPHAPQEYVDRLVWGATEQALKIETEKKAKVYGTRRISEALQGSEGAQGVRKEEGQVREFVL